MKNSLIALTFFLSTFGGNVRIIIVMNMKMHGSQLEADFLRNVIKVLDSSVTPSIRAARQQSLRVVIYLYSYSHVICYYYSFFGKGRDNALITLIVGGRSGVKTLFFMKIFIFFIISNKKSFWLYNIYTYITSILVYIW